MPSWVPVSGVAARFLIPWFVRWGLTAHQITMVSLAAGLGGAWFLQRGTYVWTVTGAAFFLAANLLDECDGGVARATGTSSGFGSWLDTVAGCVVHMSFFYSLGRGLARSSAQDLWALLGTACALGVFLATAAYVMGQSVARGREGWVHPDPPRALQPEFFDRFKGSLRSDFSVVVLLAAVAGSLGWLLWGGLVGTFLFWIPADLWSASRIKQRVAR